MNISVLLHALDALTPGMGLGGPQSQSGLLEEEKNTLPWLGIEPQFLGDPTYCLVTILIIHFSSLNTKGFQKLR